MQRHFASLLLFCLAVSFPAAGASLPVASRVEFQPLQAQAARVAETFDFLGEPLTASVKTALKSARSVDEIQEILDPLCVAGMTIGPGKRPQAQAGPAAPVLDEQGWKSFLFKVSNDFGTTSVPTVSSPQAAPIMRVSQGPPRELGKVDPVPERKGVDAVPRWLEVAFFEASPARPQLSGLEVEYKILQVFAADRGFEARKGDAIPPRGSFSRAARLLFDVTNRLPPGGEPSAIDMTFTTRPAVPVLLHVRDDGGAPTMASLTFRDQGGRVYPAQSKRLAPDFFFHPQIYRKDGESVRLPPGKYSVSATRGPEYIAQKQEFEVPANPTETNKFDLNIQLKRWVNPATLGWISGDHHIHAAGCQHYDDPTQGVLPRDMWRLLLGEDLRVGCALTWGPCYYYQKQFFTGKPDKLSTDQYVMRYDIEVSGWASAPAGHLVLLRLKNQDYPGATTLEGWPHLGLSVLKWAKAQGAVTGPAHSGSGIAVPGTELPNYNVPACDGIGADEFIMQITHEVPGPHGKMVPAIDFMSMADTPYVWEVNMWYHTLNNGFRTKISGETDFPCVYGDRVGVGRGYVKLDSAPRKIDFDSWVDGVAAGRAYVGDGKSHLMNFTVAGREVGTAGSEVRLAKAGTAVAKMKVAAYLGEVPNAEVHDRPYTEKPYWDIERARIGSTREVPLELVVNGRVVAKKNILADGATRDIEFDNVAISQSSWVAARILPSVHTNPVFVLVENKPIRASRRSAEWALATVDMCWQKKRANYNQPGEQETAYAAYEHARQAYRRIMSEAAAE